MKQAIDNNGNIVQVSIDTVVRTENGINYLLTTEEQQEYDDRQTAWNAAANSRQKNILRNQRKPLLEEADYNIFKIEDAGGDPSSWRIYRQALRDVTDQQDIFNVTWPIKP